ncbi:DUF6770 family protein [Urechidicola croceus]|uniref:Uncharacterized protein n=1 Tax=Urechidicola croceus TaxID=1850246 RepID=A0A1D8P3Z7_9FLAO|nr:DUF6770 family protein [Urechidicola croceus]AOW19267.1 hypothetical protein LPB138_00555 [Urechidicola croceus]
MKKLIVVLTLIISTTFSQAQVSNLANLASGKLKRFSPIYEPNNDVYGYFALYFNDQISADEEKYEYVILDKNLNKVANGEFIDVTYKKLLSKFYSPDKIGNKLFLTKKYMSYDAHVSFLSNRILNLDNNTVSEPFYFKENEFVEGNKDADGLRKIEKKIPFMNIPLAVNDGFLLLETEKNTQIKSKATAVRYYDVEKNKIWEHNFDFGKKKVKYYLSEFDKENLFFTFYTDINGQMVNIRRYDVATGEMKFDYLLEDKYAEYNHVYNIKQLDGNTIITGKISPYKTSGYDYKKAAGLFKIVIDGEGNEIFKKYFLWEDANKFVEMNEKGKLEGGYRLLAKDYFIFNDGKISVLTEKLKSGYNILLGNMIKTTDFVLLEFDQDFVLNDMKVLEKDLSKWSSSDYLYSQYLNEENDAVFFYQDYQQESDSKEKNWVLGIVALINGEMNHEKIPMSSDNHYIYPYVAKEGYILLRELNKDAEFDEIRLEKLNY